MIYTQAQKKTASAPCTEETISLELTIDPEGKAEKYHWDITAVFIQNKNDRQIEISASSSFPGKELVSRTVYSDGKIYIEDNGKYYQAEMDDSMLQTRIYRIYPDTNLTVSQLKELDAKSTEDGLLLNFSADAKTVKFIADFAMNQIQNFQLSPPTDVKTKKSKGKILVDSNSCISLLELQIPCVITQNGTDWDAVLEYSKAVDFPDSLPAIDVESLKEYPEVSVWDLPW